MFSYFIKFLNYIDSLIHPQFLQSKFLINRHINLKILQFSLLKFNFIRIFYILLHLCLSLKISRFFSFIQAVQSNRYYYYTIFNYCYLFHNFSFQYLTFLTIFFQKINHFNIASPYFTHYFRFFIFISCFIFNYLQLFLYIQIIFGVLLDKELIKFVFLFILFNICFLFLSIVLKFRYFINLSLATNHIEFITNC